MTLSLPEDQYMTVEGLKIRYWHVGSKGPYIVMIHGIAASCEYWYRNVRDLSKNYRVIVFDLPGFGKSDKPDVEYTIDYFREFTKKFVDALKIDSFHLFAHSLGGSVALSFALRYPGKIKKMILINNVGFSRQLTILFRLLNLPGAACIMLNTNQAMYAKMLRRNVFKSNSIVDALVDLLYPLVCDPLGKRTLLNIIKHNTSLFFGMKKSALKPITSRLHELASMPIAVFWGKDDTLLSYKPHINRAKKLLPNATFFEYENCRHIPQIEYPGKFNRDAMRFLEE